MHDKRHALNSLGCCMSLLWSGVLYDVVAVVAAVDVLLLLLLRWKR